MWKTTKSIFLDSILRSPYMEEGDKDVLESDDSFFTRFYDRFIIYPNLKKVFPPLSSPPPISLLPHPPLPLPPSSSSLSPPLLPPSPPQA